MTPFLDPVYPLTHAPAGAGLSHVDLARAFLRAGCRFFQVRAKELSDRELYGELTEITAACRERAARFLVNDRADLAWACGAAGVHLGQQDLPVSAARRMLGNGAIIGLSTHTESQFLQAQDEDVDYVAAGPVFASATKPGGPPPLGLPLLSRLVTQSRVPVVAIGGINLRNVSEIWRAGAASAAVISDIVFSSDPADRVRAYLELAETLRSGR
jgi:thiamine-phosphate pyrophosphorylase